MKIRPVGAEVFDADREKDRERERERVRERERERERETNGRINKYDEANIRFS
jgi:hypothetical protein